MNDGMERHQLMATVIDPFAPADSPQHPANWVAAQLAGDSAKLAGVPLKVLPEDDAPPWIRLDDEPLYASQPDADDVADKRWDEYHALLRAHGSPEQVEIYDVLATVDWPKGMPTLTELRALGPVTTVQDPAPVPTGQSAAEADLAAKLAALDKAGL